MIEKRRKKPQNFWETLAYSFFYDCKWLLRKFGLKSAKFFWGICKWLTECAPKDDWNFSKSYCTQCICKFFCLRAGPVDCRMVGNWWLSKRSPASGVLFDVTPSRQNLGHSISDYSTGFHFRSEMTTDRRSNCQNCPRVGVNLVQPPF